MRTTFPAGEIVDMNVSAEDYLAHYAAQFHEWVQGVVIKMSPESLRHALLIKYLMHVLDAYFELNPIGRALTAPFVMRLANSFREPDVQVILDGNPGELAPTGMLGPADICIEVVSPESVTRDYGEKFAEYEAAGVREYWIIDPARRRCQFNRLDESGLYPDPVSAESGTYRTPLLPRLALDIATLWQDDLPGISAVVQAVQAMFEV
jgi:Uma2 family endonuclease